MTSGVTPTIYSILIRILRNVVRLYLRDHFRYDNDVVEPVVQYLLYYTCALQETNGAPFHFIFC